MKVKMCQTVIAVVMAAGISAAFAQETMRIEKSRQDIDEAQRMEQKINSRSTGVVIENGFRIKNMVVTGKKVLSEEELSRIAAQFSDKVISADDVRELTAKIDQACANKGYARCRAVLTHADRESGIVEIEIKNEEGGYGIP